MTTRVVRRSWFDPLHPLLAYLLALLLLLGGLFIIAGIGALMQPYEDAPEPLTCISVRNGIVCGDRV